MSSKTSESQHLSSLNIPSEVLNQFGLVQDDLPFIEKINQIVMEEGLVKQHCSSCLLDIKKIERLNKIIHLGQKVNTIEIAAQNVMKILSQMRYSSFVNPVTFPGDNLKAFLGEHYPFFMELTAEILPDEQIRAYADSLAERVTSYKSDLLLRIITFTRITDRVITAASNAIMILFQSGYSFYGLDLNQIKIRLARLNGIILDKCNVREAKLLNCELRDASFNEADLESSEVTNSNFGLMPYLQHDGMVLGTATGKQLLVSQDQETLYFWSIERGELLAKRAIKSCETTVVNNQLSNQLFPPIFLAITDDERHLFRAYGDGYVEVWSTDSFSCISVRQYLSIGNSIQYFSATNKEIILVGKVNDEVCFHRLQLDQSFNLGEPETWRNLKECKEIGEYGYSHFHKRFFVVSHNRQRSGFFSLSSKEYDLSNTQINWNDLNEPISAFSVIESGRSLVIAQGHALTIRQISNEELTLKIPKIGLAYGYTINSIKPIKGSLHIQVIVSAQGGGYALVLDLVNGDPFFLLIERMDCGTFQKPVSNQKSLILPSENLIFFTAIPTEDQRVWKTMIKDAKFFNSNLAISLNDYTSNIYIHSISSGRLIHRRSLLPLLNLSSSDLPAQSEEKNNRVVQFEVLPTARNDKMIFKYGESNEIILQLYSQNEKLSELFYRTSVANFRGYTLCGEYLLIFETGALKFVKLPNEEREKCTFLDERTILKEFKSSVVSLESSTQSHGTSSFALFYPIPPHYQIELYNYDWDRKTLELNPINKMIGETTTAVFDSNGDFYFLAPPATITKVSQKGMSKSLFLRRHVEVFDVTRNGRFLAAISIEDRRQKGVSQLVFWDINQNKELFSADIPHFPNNVMRVKFSPEEDCLITYSDSDIRCWEIAEEKLRLKWRLPQQLEWINANLRSMTVDEHNRHFFAKLGFKL